MAVVVDTSILIDHLRGHPHARETLRRALADGERLTASVLTKVEVLAGMRPAEERATRLLLRLLEWIEVDDALAERAGALANEFAAAYPGVDPVDYVIAATAMRVQGLLLTRNVKHFPMFPELEAPY